MVYPTVEVASLLTSQALVGCFRHQLRQCRSPFLLCRQRGAKHGLRHRGAARRAAVPGASLRCQGGRGYGTEAGDVAGTCADPGGWDKDGESFMGGLVFFFLFLTVDLKGIRVGN